MRWWWLALLCACEETTPPSEVKPSASVAVGRASSAPSAASASAPSTKAPATASAAPIASDTPPPADRWDGAPVRALDGAPDGCAAHELTPWIRVACRGATSVTVTRGGGDGTTYAVRTPEEAALVTRFVEGAQMRAQVAWGERSRGLVVRWPKGQARPDVVGGFAEP